MEKLQNERDFEKKLDVGLSKAAGEVYETLSVCPVLKYKDRYEVDKSWKKRCTNEREARFKREAVYCWKLHWVEGRMPQCVKWLKGKTI